MEMTEELLERIKKQNLIREGERVITGVSGGADSVCLLLLLCRLREQYGFELEAVHVEHGIRGEESRADAAFVKELCNRHDVPCRIYPVDAPGYAAECGLGLEEAARRLRYQCFREAAGGEPAKLALAHHANDNAETVLFQMIRGSALRGLGGMRRERAESGTLEIIRPLLGTTRAELEECLQEAGQSYRTDATNRETEYSRNRIRQTVIPELERINPAAVLHICQSASDLQEAADYLEKQVERKQSEYSENEPDGAVVSEGLLTEPPIFRRAYLHRLLCETAGSSRDIGRTHVENVQRLFECQVGRRLSLPYGLTAERVYGGVRVARTSAAEYTKSGEQTTYELPVDKIFSLKPGEEWTLALPDGTLRVSVRPFCGKMEDIAKKKYTKWFDYDKIQDELQIRRRCSGDYFILDEAGHRKKLKEYFITEKIPARRRDDIWLVAEGSRVLWVIGERIGADVKITANTKKILEIQMSGGNYYED